jgi:hypothetical protein
MGGTNCVYAHYFTAKQTSAQPELRLQYISREYAEASVAAKRGARTAVFLAPAAFHWSSARLANHDPKQLCGAGLLVR